MVTGYAPIGIYRKAIGPNSEPQRIFQASRADIAIFGGSAGGGKALEVNTPIPTPTGWALMGEIQDGDMVLGANGLPVRVAKAHPPYLPQSMYRLTFDDGSVIECDGDHLWETSTCSERASSQRSDPDVQAKRRSSRPSRATDPGSLRSLTTQKRNRDRALLARKDRKRQRFHEVRSTQDIYSTLRVGSRINHSVRLAKPLELSDTNLTIPPYILGLWLGDGHTSSGGYTSADVELVTSMCDEYHTTRINRVLNPKTGVTTYNTYHPTLTQDLKTVGVLGCKHIPPVYLRASITQRISLLQGLMDTDGYCSRDGKTSFTTTCETLKDGFLELVCSLGIKARASEGIAKLYGKDCGPVWDIHFSAPWLVFRLARKSSLQKLARRPSTQHRFIVGCDPIEPSTVRCLTVYCEDSLYLCGKSMIPTHNSFALGMETLKRYQNRGFRALAVRSKYSDIIKPGALLDTFRGLYLPQGAKYRGSPVMEFSWPQHDSLIQLAGLESEEAVEQKWFGSAAQLMLFDELGLLQSSKMFWDLITRLRGAAGFDPYVRCSTNPAQNWVKDLIAWWIDTDGYAIEERSGIIRWFARNPSTDQLSFFGSRAEAERYLKSIDDFGMVTKSGKILKVGQIPKSLTFVRSKLTDNVDMRDPTYMSTLAGMDRARRKALLDGCWASVGGGIWFDRMWVDTVNEAPNPQDVKLTVRGWDKAHSAPHDSNRDPDWTVGVKMQLLKDGRVYIADVQRFRLDPGGTIRRISEVVKQDGNQCAQAVFQDPSSGKSEMELVILPAIKQACPGVRIEVEPAKLSKEEYFRMFSAAIDPETKSNPKLRYCLVKAGQPWADEYYAELERFGPDSKGKKDQVDATSRAWLYLQRRSKPSGLSAWTTENA